MSLSADVAVAVGDFDLDIQLTVATGEVLAVLGPNGSGKSTLLRTIAGLLPIDSGRIAIDGCVLDDPEAGIFLTPDQRPIGVVFQDYLLFAHLSALDNVAFGLRARGVAKSAARTTAARWLDRFGLGEQSPLRPDQLSGGQAQRVALARALVTDPAMLLLDEPLSALDAGARQDVRRSLRQHLDTFGGMRLLVTHDPIDAYALADRVAILEHGRIAQIGTIAEVTAHPRSRYVADLVGTNLLRGMVTDGSLLTDSGARLVVAAENGPVFAAIRPQAITLSLTHDPSSSARNIWQGIVGDIDRLGDRVRVGVTGPLPVVAEITTAALEALDLHSGDPVHVAVKATEITTYPA